MSSANPQHDVRPAGNRRGRERRELLLTAVTEDLAVNGLVDFSLRRAARAAGTTHKVLLYHFGSAESLLGEAMLRLRQQRIESTLPAATEDATLGERVVAFWPALADDATGLRVIDQAIGLAMYDADRYGHLAAQATELYLDPLADMCPARWGEERKREVANMALAAMRGFLMEWRTTRDQTRIAAGLNALRRALDEEESRT